MVRKIKKEMLTSTEIARLERLTKECHDIQLWGKKVCKDCLLKNNRRCGGKQIKKTGKNSKGFVVPVDIDFLQ